MCQRVPVRSPKRRSKAPPVIHTNPDPLGRSARELSFQPPLVHGGHYFVTVGEGWWQCTGCYFVCPSWVISEGFVTTHAGRYCPALFKMLEDR